MYYYLHHNLVSSFDTSVLTLISLIGDQEVKLMRLLSEVWDCQNEKNEV